MSSQSGLGTEMYSGAATYGEIRALIGAIVGTIIGVIMIGLGIDFILKKKVNFDSVNATILNVNCAPQNIQNNQNNQNIQTQNQNCNINVSYTYNGKSQNKFIQYTGSYVYSVNQQVTVYINKDNENDIYLIKPNIKDVGIILLIIGLILIIGGWFVYWLTRRYKFFAAAEGVAGAYSLFRN
jgi:hypothetical protein